MPLSNKALKKREQARDAANGIVRDELVKRKMETAKKDVACTICGTLFKLTKRNVDSRMHAESKHPQSTFATCFPEVVVAEEADKKASADATKKNGGRSSSSSKKKEDSMALLAEGLAATSVKKKGSK